MITGRNHHVAGFGVVGEIATGFPGYDSVIRKENGTIGTILKENGYATSWFGKNHNTPFYQATQAGPFDQWPVGMGFEYFYGFVGGDASQWQPNLFRNTTAIYPFEGNPGWNLTTAMADEAIQYMKQLKEIAPDKPFLVYYVPGGTHAPHHPTPEWIKKISDMHLFDDGWNKLRETIFANQKRLGIMPANAKLTAWPKELPEWDSLSLEEKKLFIKQADVYGAYLAYTDHEIGRVIQAVEDLGAARQHPDHLHQRRQRRERRRHAQRHAERVHHLQWRSRAGQGPVPLVRVLGIGTDLPALCGRLGVGDGHAVQVDEAGGVALRRDGPGRGHVVARPHQRRGRHPPPVSPRHRHRSDHPRSDRHPGAGYDQRHQAAPHGRREHGLHLGQGERQRPVPAHHAILRDARQPRHLPRRLGGVHDPGDAPVGTEHRAAARRDHRVQVGTLQRRRRIPPQSNDLAAKMPDKLKQMQALFYLEAKKHDVLPLDNSSLARWNAPRPNLTAGRTVFTYSGGLTGVPNSGAPSILNKSYTITAEVEIPEGGAEGMIVTDGGRFGGYGLFLSKGEFGIGRGKPVFLYNLLDLKRTMWEGPELGAGKHTIVFDFKSDGPGLGKGGTGVLSVDGKEVARNSMEHTTPITFPEDETFDIGQDTRTGVAMLEYRYDPPFKFTGKINKLTFKLEPKQ